MADPFEPYAASDLLLRLGYGPAYKAKGGNVSKQAPAGWYPDGHGNERYWDGKSWTDQLRSPENQEAAVDAEPGALSKMGAKFKSAAAAGLAAVGESARKQAEDAEAAGALVTSGVFGTSTIEIYENGFVRVASWGEGSSGSTTRTTDKKTPYERLRSIKFTEPEDDRMQGASGLEDAVGPAVSKLLKGGKGLMKASAPGMAAAGISSLASNAAKKSFLTIVTDRQIHTLTNQKATAGVKLSKKGHNDVARALVEAAESVLGTSPESPSVDAEPRIASPEPVAATQGTTTPALSDRLRELATLHSEGILSDDEFASAKAKLLSEM